MIPFRQRFKFFFRRDSAVYASSMGLVACCVLAIGGIAMGYSEHSLIVQTNGLIALIDIAAAILFVAAVERSMRRADVTFNYGYGKYESLAILVSSTLLAVLTIYTLVEVFTRWTSPAEASTTWLLVLWSVISLIVMRNTMKRLQKYAKNFHFPMLEYDAELWRVDSLVELGVIAGVLIGGVLRYYGYHGYAMGFDGASSIALLIITLAVPLRHGAEAVRQLLDRTLPDKMQFDILKIIAENNNRMCEFKRVHTRRSGKDIFIEIDLVMPYDYTLDELYVLENDMVSSLHQTFPTAIPRVYVTPCDRTCEFQGASHCPVKEFALKNSQTL